MKNVMLSGFLFVFFPLSVIADQCAWVEKDVAEKADALLKQQSTFLSYCEPCGEKKPTEIEVDSVSVQQPTGAGDYYEVLINDENVDLAYTYIKQGEAYHNLAILTGCVASSVSRVINYPLTVSESSKYALYLGTFKNETGSVTYVISEQNLHGPAWLRLQIQIISDEWGDSRSDMVGYLQMDQSKPTYFTPYQGCKLYFDSKVEGRLIVSSSDECRGALENKLVGVFVK